MIVSNTIDYELRCSCGAIKHEKTRRDIITWYLIHRSSLKGLHVPKIFWFYKQGLRELSKAQIQEFIDIDFIQSGKAEENDKKYPWGLPGLGGGKPRGLE